MSRLKIYSGTNGRLVHDSDGAVTGTSSSDNVKADYFSNVLLYYNPSTPSVRCYIRLVRDRPEQFMTTFVGEAPSSGDFVKTYKRTVTREIEQRDG